MTTRLFVRELSNIGMGVQQARLAAQAVLAKKDVSIGVSLIFFAQSLGGAIFVCVGQSVSPTLLSLA
ncbi:hypothetical protein V1520DRAFT_354587 [Lipomyces starkeyi]